VTDLSDSLDTLTNQWVYHLKHKSSHDHLYTEFDRLLEALSKTHMPGSASQLRGTSIFRALLEELNYVILAYRRHEVFNLQAPGARAGPYELCTRSETTGPCGGPHLDMVFSLAQPWRRYVEQCYRCIGNLLDASLLFIEWPHEGLSEIESELLSQPLRTNLSEAHRGCWRAFFHCDIDARMASGVLSKVGFLPSEQEKRYVTLDEYPPDESLFSHPDDQVFSNLLEGVCRSRHPVAKLIVARFLDDDEPWVRNLAAQLISSR